MSNSNCDGEGLDGDDVRDGNSITGDDGILNWQSRVLDCVIPRIMSRPRRK